MRTTGLLILLLLVRMAHGADEVVIDRIIKTKFKGSIWVVVEGTLNFDRRVRVVGELKDNVVILRSLGADSFFVQRQAPSVHGLDWHGGITLSEYRTRPKFIVVERNSNIRFRCEIVAIPNTPEYIQKYNNAKFRMGLRIWDEEEGVRTVFSNEITTPLK